MDQGKPTLLIDARYTLYDTRYKYNSMLEKAIKSLASVANCYFIFTHKSVEKNKQLATQFEAKFNITPELQIPKIDGGRIFIVTHNFKSFKIDQPNCLILFSSTLHKQGKKATLEMEFYEKKLSSYHVSHLEQVIGCLREDYSWKHTVGYFFQPKKMGEMLRNGIVINNSDFRFVPLDFRYFNSHQYKTLALLFHKITELSKKSEVTLNGLEVQLSWENFRRFLQEVRVPNLDPIERLPDLVQRDVLSQILSRMLSSSEYIEQSKAVGLQIRMSTPRHINFDNHVDGGDRSMLENIAYPVIVKTKQGALTDNCHMMSIVSKREGLDRLLKHERFRCELIVQEIINHKSTIYKMYSLGRELIIQKRKSIPDIEVENFQFDEGFYVFDSQQDLFSNVSKCLKVVDEKDHVNQRLDHEEGLFKHFKTLARLISEEFNIEMFGFDVIGDIQKLEFYIIDINHFPGYKNVANLVDLFKRLFLEKIK